MCPTFISGIIPGFKVCLAYDVSNTFDQTHSCPLWNSVFNVTYNRLDKISHMDPLTVILGAEPTYINAYGYSTQNKPPTESKSSLLLHGL